MTSTIEFFCRLWTRDGEIESFAVWVHELEKPNYWPEDWARNYLSDCDLCEEFEVPKTGVYQILFRAKLRGWQYSLTEEYDETMEVLDVQKCQMPDDWFDEQ